LLIGDLVPGFFGGRRVGGQTGDRAEIGGWVLLPEALDRFGTLSFEVRSDDGDEPCSEGFAQARGFVSHERSLQSKKPGPLSRPGGFPPIGRIDAEYRRKRRKCQEIIFSDADILEPTRPGRYISDVIFYLYSRTFCLTHR
jgi:hypothetical protein